MDKQIRDKLIKVIKKQCICCNGNDCDECCYDGDDCVEERLADAILDSNLIITEGAVVLTEKEYKRYERIEKTIKLAKREKANGYEVKNGKLYYFSNLLEGFEYEFKDLQEICDAANHYNEEFWGLDQRLAFWQGKAEETRKETAEKFARKCKQRLSDKLHRGKALHTTVFGKEYVRRIFKESIDEICKEITEVKNGN